MNFAMKFLSLKLVLLCLCLVNGSVVPQLRAVSMLFRHGDRAPTGSYPLDPYKDYPWYGGFGALSLKGAEELFQAGLIKAGRYSSLIADCMHSNCHFANKLVVKSSAVQRCVDSAENFLNAFLPVPVPQDLIYVIPPDEDEMLGYPGKTCPKYENSLNTVSFSDPIFSNIIDFQSQQGKELIQYLEDNTGLNISSPLEIIMLADTFYVEQDNGLELPAWTDSVYEQYIEPMSAAVLSQMGESEFMMVRMGVFLNDMLEKFESFIRGTSEQNMLVYSAHDVTLMGVIAGLEITDQTSIRPQYGALIAFELYDTPAIANDLEIRILYSKDYGDLHPITINIPNCAAPCAFKDFIGTVRSKLTKSFEKDCQV